VRRCQILAVLGSPLGQSFKIRFAPVERVLAWRERLEDRESEGIYRQATGDSETDQLFGRVGRSRSHTPWTPMECESVLLPTLAEELVGFRIASRLSIDTFRLTILEPLRQASTLSTERIGSEALSKGEPNTARIWHRRTQLA